MTKREKFINIIQKEIFDREDIYVENYEKDWNDIKDFWSNFIENKALESKPFTENGAKILVWLQKNTDEAGTLFTAKEIAEGLFTTGRSVSGTLRKLVNDEYVNKIGDKPIRYSLTEKGQNCKI